MLGLLNHEKVLIGYDLGDDFAQISYTFPDGKEVETLSLVAGEENYAIPAVLCKKPGENRWLYGREALRCAKEQDGILVDKLLSHALDGEEIQIDGQGYNPVALLSLFIKRSLGLLAQVSSVDKIYAMLFTCENPDRKTMEVLSLAVGRLNLKTEKIFFKSRGESFYDYMLHQPQELWTGDSVLCDYREGRILIYRMECNRRTTPTVVFAEKEEHPFADMTALPEEGSFREARLKKMDEEFLKLITPICRNRRVSSVFLIGDAFSEEWMKESLKYLCSGRRVFQGNNLYSKGAGYGLQEKINPGELSKEYVFLGKDKLRANIGMKLFRQGEESYYALLNAGDNWYEARQTLELYVQEGNCIEVQITPLTGRGNMLAQISLEDLKENLSRLKASFYMEEENRLVVEIEDLGLGELYPATHRIWKEEIVIY